MITPSTLFAGGVFAAIMAGWSQVKSLAASLTRIVVVQVDLESQAASVLYEYLRLNWKEGPTGKLRVFDYSLKLTNGKRRPVPFLMADYDQSKLFYAGKKFVFMCPRDMRLRYVRGMFDLNATLKEAYQTRYSLMDASEQSSRSSRFVTIQKFGPVSETARQFALRGGKSGSNDEVAEAPVGLSDSFRLMDHRLETPVFHSRSEFAEESRSDPLKGRYFSKEQQQLLDDAIQWLSSESWYADRVLPWRMGWTVFGPPGTGKSTIAEYAARLLGIPIYVWHLKTYDDPSFHEGWVAMERPCVALFDDFDTSFNGRKPVDPEMKLTFDCLLNTLSGPGDLSNGVLSIFCTNLPETFDPALASPRHGGKEKDMVTRPGRIDRVVEMGYISLDEAIRVMRLVTLDDDFALQEAVNSLKSRGTDKLTPISALTAARVVLQRKLVDERLSNVVSLQQENQ